MELHSESEFKPVCSSIQSWLLVQTCPECHIEPRHEGKTLSQDKILPFEVHLKHTTLFVCCHMLHAATICRTSHIFLVEMFVFNWWGMQCVWENVLLFHVHSYALCNKITGRKLSFIKFKIMFQERNRYACHSTSGSRHGHPWPRISPTSIVGILD